MPASCREFSDPSVPRQKARVADSIRELEKREDDLSKAGVTMLGNVDGKSMVEQMSPQFLEFVLDAYRSLKYRK